MDQNPLFLLVVDDDDVDREMVMKSLVSLNAKVIEAKTGEECLKHLDENTFDCILIDHVLPDHDSTSLIKEIKFRNYDTPIIVITGQGDEVLAVTLMKLGALDYIPKDRVDGMLAKTVRNAIRIKLSEEKIEFYRNFYNTAPIGFYTTCIRSGKFLRANPTCIKMLGFSTMEELRAGCKSTELYPPEDRERLLSRIQREGIVTDFEIQLNLPNGRKMWVLLSARHCKQGGCIEGSVIDITDKKEMQAELESQKLKGLESLTQMGKAIEKHIEDSFRMEDLKS